MTRQQELWLEALESDEFTQARGYLQDEESFCCLGVACVVAERNGVAVGRNNYGRVAGMTLSSQNDVSRWLKLRTPEGCPRDYQPETTLIKLNDTGMTFKEIAQTIRNNPEQYFLPEETNDSSTGTVAASS